MRLSEAPSHGKPALLYDVQSKGAQGYLSLARELLARDRGASARGAEPSDAHDDARPTPKRRALGRGLDALLPARAPRRAAYGDRSVFTCPLEKIVPQKGQPRQHFDAQKLDELARVIREHGLIEPLVVRRMPGRRQVRAHRRRAALARARSGRACARRSSSSRTSAPKDAFELALIENVQREDLNPIELAEALRAPASREHGYTQEALAERARQGPDDDRQRAAPAQAAGARAREGRRAAS